MTTEILTFWAAILLQVGAVSGPELKMADLDGLVRGLTTCRTWKHEAKPRCVVELDRDWQAHADRPFKLQGGGTSRYIGWQNTLLHEACHVKVFEGLVYAKRWQILKTYDAHGERWKSCMELHGGHHNH